MITMTAKQAAAISTLEDAAKAFPTDDPAEVLRLARWINDKNAEVQRANAPS